VYQIQPELLKASAIFLYSQSIVDKFDELRAHDNSGTDEDVESLQGKAGETGASVKFSDVSKFAEGFLAENTGVLKFLFGDDLDFLILPHKEEEKAEKDNYNCDYNVIGFGIIHGSHTAGNTHQEQNKAEGKKALWLIHIASDLALVLLEFSDFVAHDIAPSDFLEKILQPYAYFVNFLGFHLPKFQFQILCFCQIDKGSSL